MDKKVNIGDKVLVKITTITKFGAFCDLIDGGSGLIHISEIDNKYISNIEEYLHAGDVVEVVVTKILEKKNTYALSLKKANRRKRQSLLIKNKPLNRKDQNKEFLNSFSYALIQNNLESSIESEYKRLTRR